MGLVFLRELATPACPAFAEAASRRQAKRLAGHIWFNERKHSGVQARTFWVLAMTWRQMGFLF
jgi:hypothetical protein